MYQQPPPSGLGFPNTRVGCVSQFTHTLWLFLCRQSNRPTLKEFLALLKSRPNYSKTCFYGMMLSSKPTLSGPFSLNQALCFQSPNTNAPKGTSLYAPWAQQKQPIHKQGKKLHAPAWSSTAFDCENQALLILKKRGKKISASSPPQESLEISLED